MPCRGVDFNDNVGELLKPEPTKYSGVYSLDVFMARIDKIITEHASWHAHGTETAKPLFLYAAWQNCHDPYDVPQKYIDMYPHVQDAERRNMSAMISALDEGIGATVDSLHASGLWESSLLVAHTDNGGELPYQRGGEPGVPNENGGAGNNFPLRELGPRSAALVQPLPAGCVALQPASQPASQTDRQTASARPRPPSSPR